MQSMYGTFVLINQIENTIKINAIFTLLNQLPFKLKCVNYANYKLKKKLTFASVLLEMLRQILIGVLGFVIGIGILLYFLREYESTVLLSDAFYKLFFFLYICMGSLTNIVAFETGENSYISIKRFHMNPKTYYFSSLLMRHIWNLCGELPIFIIGMIYFHLCIWPIIPLLFVKELFGAFGEMLHIQLFSRKQCILSKNARIIIAIKSFFLIAGYAAVFLCREISVGVGALVVIGITAFILGIIGVHYLIRYHGYLEIYLAVNKADELTMDYNAIMHEKELEKIQMNGESASTQIDSPYDYITSLFFERHKTLIYENATRVWIFCTVAFCGYLGYFFYSRYSGIIGIWMVRYYGYLIISIYGLLNSKKVIKLFFTNCDCGLLKYRFYRTDRAIIANYLSRMMKLLKTNIITVTPVALLVILIGTTSQITVTVVLSIVVIVFTASIFFSVHELFLYYMFEPYSIETDLIKPSYRVAEYICMMLIVSLIFLEVSSVIFSILAVSVTLLYVIVSSIVVYKTGSRRFVLW